MAVAVRSSTLKLRGPLKWWHALQFPEGQRDEIVRGRHYVTPTPCWEHQAVGRNLDRILAPYFAGHPGLGEFMPSPIGVVLSETDYLEPDFVFLARRGKARLRGGRVHGPPALVGEVLSRSTRRRDEGVKKAVYEAFGCANYWIADPKARTLVAHRIEDGAYIVEASSEAGDVFRPSLFPGLRIKVGEVFAPTRA